MKILLASAASYDPPRGGSTRSNLAWLRHLAGSGHECRVVCGFPLDRASGSRDAVVHEGIALLPAADDVRRAALRREIQTSQPDFVLVSSEDLSHMLLAESCRYAADRVVYLAHTPQFYPFGPAAWNPDPEAAASVAQCAGVVAIAEFTARYIREHGGCCARVIHPPVYGPPPFRKLGSPESGAVAMINPCAVKGIGIFASLARRFPQRGFAALPGWGTTSSDCALLESLPNFRWLEPCRDIEQMLGQTRLLLMPSLWLEGFGLIVVEAMLRGIPVLAADEGGLRESSLETARTIPVHPIREFTGAFDERHLPVPVVPEQDIEPWAEAIWALEDTATYESESQAVKQAAEGFVSGLRAEDFEQFLKNLNARGESRVLPTPPVPALSPERRELLLRRLRHAHQNKKSVHP